MRTPQKNTSQILLLIAVGLSQFIVCADYFSVAIALPRMAAEFNVRTVDLQWVITGYILSFCAVLGIAGPLGDRFGRKKLLLLGIAIFTLVSIWIGTVQSVTALIASRIALGIGGGLLFPLATAVISHASTKVTLVRNLAFLTGIATIGSAMGPVLGGVLTEEFNWRWIFFANVPFGMAAFLMVLFFARDSRDPERSQKFDVLGIVLLVVGLGAVSVGIDRIPHWSLEAWLALLLGGVVCIGGFVLAELQMAQPIIDIRLFRNRTFIGNAICGMLANSAWCALVFLTTLQLQKVLGFPVLEAGLFFLFLAGSTMLASFMGPMFERRVGSVMLVRAALILQSIALATLYWTDGPVGLAIGTFVAGVGCAWGWAMPQAGAIATLPREKAGLASGSIMTLMIMSGNTAIVLVAMVIGLEPGTVEGESVGVQIGFGLSALAASLGIVMSFTVLRSAPSNRPALRA